MWWSQRNMKTLLLIDLWNNPLECSVEFPFWFGRRERGGTGRRVQYIVAPVGVETLAHTEG
jgi:hypothetical protein